MYHVSHKPFVPAQTALWRAQTNTSRRGRQKAERAPAAIAAAATTAQTATTTIAVATAAR